MGFFRSWPPCLFSRARRVSFHRSCCARSRAAFALVFDRTVGSLSFGGQPAIGDTLFDLQVIVRRSIDGLDQARARVRAFSKKSSLELGVAGGYHQTSPAAQLKSLRVATAIPRRQPLDVPQTVGERRRTAPRLQPCSRILARNRKA